MLGGMIKKSESLLSSGENVTSHSLDRGQSLL